MRYCGFWPPSTSLDFPEAFTCFSADDLVEHLRSEKQILTSDVVFIEPDPSYWEKALTPDTKQFLRSAIIEGHSTKGEEVTDEQIVSVCGKGLFPDLNKYSDPLGLEDVLREWLLKKVFGDLYSGILNGPLLVFSYPVSKSNKSQKAGIQRLITMLSENLLAHDSPPPSPGEVHATMDQISQQVESSGIRKETVFWVANIARHESIEGRRSFNLEVEDIPNFQTTSAWEFDSRFKALESGPREVIATTLNRTKRGVPVSRSYFFPGFEAAMVFVNALDATSCIEALERRTSVGTDVAPAPVGLIESQDDASPPNMAVMTTAISTGESNVSNSGPQGKEENASPSSSTSPTSPVSQPIELPKGGAPDENQIQETDEASHSFSKTKDEVLLKFLSTGDVDRKRSQKVLIEFSGHKFWLGAATATYLLCFCLAAEFDDGKILNTGRTSRGLNLSGYLSGSATQPKNFNVKRLGKICYEIIGYLYKGVNSKPYFFTCGGKDYSVGDLFPKVGDKKADDRGKRFVIPPGTLGPFGGPKNSYFGTSVGGPYQ